MKRIITLLFAAAFILGSFATANAVDIRAKGQMDFAFGWRDHVGTPFMEKRNEDDFIARQRVRTQLDFIASENLRGVLYFEIGTQFWGQAGGTNSTATTPGNNNVGQSTGGQIGTDGVNIETRRAYIEWIVPETRLNIKMGLQGLALPSAVAGNPVFNDDVAAIVASYPFNDNFGLTAFWARPFDSGDAFESTAKNSFDAMDVFGVVLPITFSSGSVTPWFVYSSMGNATNFWDYSLGAGDWNTYTGEGDIFVGGVAAKINFSAFTFKFDGMYGVMNTSGSAPETKGWWLAAGLDYNASWGTPGIFAWWTSGDDADDVADGEYGRLPVIGIDQGVGFTSFGFPGSYSIGDDTMISNNGAGTLGVGVQIADLSFVNKLSHTIRVAWYMGTNDKNLRGTGASSSALLYNGTFANPIYMTTKDSAIEVNFDSKYQIYENLDMLLELGYIYLDMDDSDNRYGTDFNENAWKAQFLFQYHF